jgi:hypothetical protein
MSIERPANADELPIPSDSQSHTLELVPKTRPDMAEAPKSFGFLDPDDAYADVGVRLGLKRLRVWEGIDATPGWWWVKIPFADALSSTAVYGRG